MEKEHTAVPILLTQGLLLAGSTDVISRHLFLIFVILKERERD